MSSTATLDKRRDRAERPVIRNQRGVVKLKRSVGDRITDVCIGLVLVFLAVGALYPFLFQLTISLSTPAEAQQAGLHIFTTHPTLESYISVLKNSSIFTAYGNTILRTAIATVLAVTASAMVAYPLAQPEFPFRRAINFVIVFSMLFSGGFIAMYLLIKNLGLLDSMWSLVLPGAVSAINVIIMRNFFQAIPRELIDSARIDGASEFQILFRVVLPLSKPVLAVVGLWVGLANWNAWFDALLFITDPDKQVLQMFIRNTVITQSAPLLNGSLDAAQQLSASQQTLSAAAVMIATLPVIFVYPFLQKYFARGIMLGSVKG